MKKVYERRVTCLCKYLCIPKRYNHIVDQKMKLLIFPCAMLFLMSRIIMRINPRNLMTCLNQILRFLSSNSLGVRLGILLISAAIRLFYNGAQRPWLNFCVLENDAFYCFNNFTYLCKYLSILVCSKMWSQVFFTIEQNFVLYFKRPQILQVVLHLLLYHCERILTSCSLIRPRTRNPHTFNSTDQPCDESTLDSKTPAAGSTSIASRLSALTQLLD